MFEGLSSTSSLWLLTACKREPSMAGGGRPINEHESAGRQA
uniref:Uncharacterized protein n=1 Tax=Peronospora matthiolae TaxID=2874970 RepID=A0AAV1SYV2_9STRA